MFWLSLLGHFDHSQERTDARREWDMILVNQMQRLGLRCKSTAQFLNRAGLLAACRRDLLPDYRIGRASISLFRCPKSQV